MAELPLDDYKPIAANSYLGGVAVELLGLSETQPRVEMLKHAVRILWGAQLWVESELANAYAEDPEAFDDLLGEDDNERLNE